jgi:hypothetical protein
MNSNANLYRDSRRAAAWCIALSLGLGLAKFVVRDVLVHVEPHNR